MNSDYEIESNSDTYSDTDEELISDTEKISDLNSNSDSEINSEDSDQELTIGTIIGINKPNLSYKSPPLMFYVRVDGQSYKSCRWITKDEVSKAQKGTYLYSIFSSRHNSFQLFTPFKTNESFSNNKKFDLYIPVDSRFDEGYVTPGYIISSKHYGRTSEYLIKWQSLDILQSTWEPKEDVPFDLIKKYKHRIKNTHSICFDPTKDTNDHQFKPFLKSPIYKNGNILSDYQIECVNWLQLCWFQNKNAILSDEMGLGKTLESIGFLIFLSICYHSWGPFLIICPLSTVNNWVNEFEKWTDFRVVPLIGNKKERKIIKENLIYYKNRLTNELDTNKIICDVLVVSYEFLKTELNFIKKFNFMYTIIDEAQRIKNANTVAYKNCSLIRSHHLLLMTGTPIQNDLFEIWSLLHFVNPTEFNDYDVFESNYADRENPETIKKLQEVLRPYILRRKKKDTNLDLPEKEETIIEVEMTQIQRSFSQLLFKDNYDALKDSFKNISFKNIMMQFRKIFCHPFLFPNLEDICYSQYKEAHHIPPDQQLGKDDEMKSLVLASGKTILIDKLLPKLKDGNHKVLIFSQFTSVLDILEDYIIYKQYPYERLDGQCSTDQRVRSIDNFQNNEESFIFLLSTRAGGLGINLTKADTVIIYDSDWNPQNDIQAQARCHRIGQSNKVNIYRLITRGSYESEMFFRASKKLALDYAILDSAPKGNDIQKEKSFDDKKELEMILKNGAYYTFKDDSSEIDKFCSENIDQILEHRSHTMKDVVSGGNSKFSKASFEATSETDFYKSDFLETLVQNQKIILEQEEKTNLNEQMVTRMKDKIDYSKKPENMNPKVKITESQNIIHFIPERIENDSNLNLYELKLSDFCDIDSFETSIDSETYEKALLILRNNGIGSASHFASKPILEIFKTLVVFSFFGIPLKYRNLYYSYVKEFIPDFSKQIKRTPFKELSEKFVYSVSSYLKLKIINECFNWDILYKVVLYITNEKLPNNFLFAPEMPTYPGWTPIDDFKVLKLYAISEKHTDFFEDETLPFKEMIDKNPSMKLWILQRIKIIFSEIYIQMPKDFRINNKTGCILVQKKIGGIPKFSSLNRHILYSKRLTIYVQKKLLRILYLYGIPKFDAIKKIKDFLKDEFVSEESILIFVEKILLQAIKYHHELVEVLKLLPKINFDLIYKNDYVDINWIKKPAIIAVASNLHLIYKVRENYQVLNNGKCKNIEQRLRKCNEINEKCSWWDFKCDIALFNVTAFYGFFFNSMLYHYIKSSKPNLFEFVDDSKIEDWKEKEIINLEPIVIKGVECLEFIFSFEQKEKRVRKINDLIEVSKTLTRKQNFF